MRKILPQVLGKRSDFGIWPNRNVRIQGYVVYVLRQVMAYRLFGMKIGDGAHC